MLASDTSTPRDLATLTAAFPPLAIRTEREHAAAVGMLDTLAVLERPTLDQRRYLETLTILVQAFEAEHHALALPDDGPLPVLRYLVEEHGLSARDLGRLLGDPSLGSKILRGERELSKEHIRKLAAHFAVSPALFL